MKQTHKLKSLLHKDIFKRSVKKESVDPSTRVVVESLNESFQNTMDYDFIERLVIASNQYSDPFVHKVILRLKRLVDLDIEHFLEAFEAVPNHKKLSFLRKFRTPLVERQILRILVRRYPKYDWLPDILNISASDVRTQDKTVARWFMKRKSYSHSLDPKDFCKALNNTFKITGLVDDSRILSVDEFIEKMNKQSSSCYPHYTKKSNPNAQATMIDFIENIFKCNGKIELIKSVFSELVTVFHRFSPAVKSDKKIVKTKIRLVFGYSFQILCLQEMYHGSFIDKFLNRKPFTEGLTRPQISERVLDMRRSAIRNSNQICVSDIEGIDYRLPAISIYLAHAVMIESNRLSGCVSEGSFDAMIEEVLALYEVRTPVIGSWGHVVVTNGGTKSGTRFNTFTNSLLMQIGLNLHYISMRYPKEGLDLVREGKSDDLDFEMSQFDSIFEFSKTLSKIHMVVHPHKTHLCDPLSDKIDLLGMDWDWMGRPSKSLDWVMSKCAYPESFIDSPFDDRLVIRLVSILAQISNGIDILYYILKHVSSNVSDAFKSRKDVRVSFYKTRDGPREWITLPLKSILQMGWRMF
jgi:hypothetical protein